MEKKEQKKQMTIISQHNMDTQKFLVKEIHKADKMIITSKKRKDIEKKLFKCFAEKFKNDQNTKNNSNSNILLNRTKREKSPLRIPNISVVKKKEDQIMNTNNNRLNKNILLTKSQSINNFKKSFPIITNSKSNNKYNDKYKKKI
jgi:hypothetical protein